MIEDKIKLIIQSMVRHREDVKELKKEKRNMEKKLPDELLDLQRAKKEITDQYKAREAEFLSELREDDQYKQILEDLILQEEKVSEQKEELFKQLSKLKQNQPFLFDMDVDGRLVKFQMEPAVKIYLNGKEEKS